MTKAYINLTNQLREFNHFFNNKRLWSFFFLFLFLIHIYVTPVIDFSIAVKHKVSPWVCIFLFSSVYFDLFFLLGAIYMYSKVPFFERWQMYQQIRYGKTRWGLIQIGKIVLSAFSYVLVTIASTILMLIPNVSMEYEWGKVLYTLALTNGGEVYNEEFSISYELISENKLPIIVLCKAIVVLSLVVTLIGLIMFLVSICLSRLVAIIISTVLSVLPIIIEEMDIPLQRISIEMIPTEWVKIYKIGHTYNKVQSLDWSGIMIRLVIGIGMLSIFILYRIHKMEFNWYGEE